MPFCSQCGIKLDNNAKFCVKCGASVGTIDDTTHQNDVPERKIKYEGELRKCPNCGDPIDAFEFICDKCGYNFSTSRISTSQERLAAQLASIDAKIEQYNRENPLSFGSSIMSSQNVVEGVFSIYKDGFKHTGEHLNRSNAMIEFTRQKVACIDTFPVSNSVEEISAFMVYAGGNINTFAFDWYERKVADAWMRKMNQMYQIAKISFPSSPVFKQIEGFYIEKKSRYKNSRLIVLGLFIAIFGSSFLFIFLMMKSL